MKIIETIRRELEPLNKEIEAALKPSRETLTRFVQNQLYIVPHDLKALSISMIKTSKVDEYRFIKILVDGDWEAYKALIELAEELNIKFSWDSLDPSAVAYTHFLS
jgi:hypothetical protein